MLLKNMFVMFSAFETTIIYWRQQIGNQLISKQEMPYKLILGGLILFLIKLY